MKVPAQSGAVADWQVMVTSSAGLVCRQQLVGSRADFVLAVLQCERTCSHHERIYLAKSCCMTGYFSASKRKKGASRSAGGKSLLINSNILEQLIS